MLPVELVWAPKEAIGGLPGEYRLGYYRSTARAPDVFKDVDGLPQAITGKDFSVHDGKHGAWFTAQQQLTRVEGDASRGLSVFANVTMHDKATNVVDSFQQLGLVYRGPFNARPKDDIGLVVGRIHVNKEVTCRQRMLNAAGGINDYVDPLYRPLQKNEYDTELNYGVHVNNWLTVRPNLQYVKHPGGVEQVDAALVACLKLQLAL